MVEYIETLSELRSQYNCFDEKDRPYYEALSEAIARKPVVHGYWIENEYEWICSRCGESFEYYDNSFLQHAHFCPSCGAKICPE